MLDQPRTKPKPYVGRVVYVPSTCRTVGGWTRINGVDGDEVIVEDVPSHKFSWHYLCENQIEFVALFGGGKVITKKPTTVMVK